MWLIDTGIKPSTSCCRWGSAHICAVTAGQCGLTFTLVTCFQDTGVTEMINNKLNQPVTIFLPSDAAMAALPQQQKDYLYHPSHRSDLTEYLKYHVIQSQKVRDFIWAGQRMFYTTTRGSSNSPLSHSLFSSDLCWSSGPPGLSADAAGFYAVLQLWWHRQHRKYDGDRSSKVSALMSPTNRSSLSEIREKSSLTTQSVGSFRDTSSLTAESPTASTACWPHPALADDVMSSQPLIFG